MAEKTQGRVNAKKKPAKTASRKQMEEVTQRTDEILNVIMSLAKLDYNTKARITGKGDNFDAISGGINMLGEELKASTVSLQEKEVLLKEVHHRVKNNLQVISSLMSLQSGLVEDPFFREKMNECRERVRSMALIHEKLYQSKDLSELDFGSYMEDLCQNLSRIYNPGGNKIKMEFLNKAPGLRLKIDTAVPCGLIINELLINAFKYAFPGKRRGKIRVELDTNASGFSLSVSDNGVGMPEEKLHQTHTLGLQLVQILCNQLQAEMEFSGKKGLSLMFRVNWGESSS